MYQLLIVLLSYLLIPLLIRKKVKLSYALLITAGFLSLMSGFGPAELLRLALGLFTSQASINTILVVAMVSILGGLMKHYDMLQKIVDTILILTKSKKRSIVVIPALIGVLVIPGGAMLSAPFVNNLGQEMGLMPARRAAVNLIFRHVAMFILPFSTSLLVVVSILPALDIYKIIGLNLVMIAAMLILGQQLFLRDLAPSAVEEKSGRLAGIKDLLLYSSPIYLSVLINLIFGVPFYIAMLGSLVAVYLISDRKDFFKVAAASFNGHVVLTVIAVLMMKEVIMHLDALMAMVHQLFSASDSVWTVLAVIFFTSVLIGYITGYSVAALAVTLPLISELAAPLSTMYVYAYFAFGSAFLGYFFSPLHLCQAFTLQLMGVTTNEIYREYRLYAPLTVLALLGSAAAMLGLAGLL